MNAAFQDDPGDEDDGNGQSARPSGERRYTPERPPVFSQRVRSLMTIARSAQVDTIDRTGVEMEAMTACSVACLTIYDMCKSADRAMVISHLTLWEKTGGRSGVYRRADDGRVD